MVARLTKALDLPLRQQNALLLAAGFAPVWRATDLGAPELSAVREALDYMLAQQEPYPAVVVDRQWNLLKANDDAGRLVEFLVAPVPADISSAALKPMRLSMSPGNNQFAGTTAEL
jgi:hypothetical protein